ncbi:MAG: ATP-binding protein [Lentisphaeria bacterium]|nr:ATP-binding protein [Lentisphaeria bacterium]
MNHPEIIKVKTNCTRCGKEFEAETFQFVLDSFAKKGKPYAAACDDCFRIIRQEEEEAMDRAFAERQQSEEELEEAIAAAGVAPDYRLKTAPVPFVAKWLWKNREKNILLSGQTGTGKSTSAGVNTRYMIRDDHKTVRVCYFAALLDEWRAARCADADPGAVKDLFRRLEAVDVLIIDECAGKSVNTDSSREFMYRLIEDVQNGCCHAKVWFLGNFYRGSVDDVFGDAEPTYRRLKEKFVCGRIDLIEKQIIPIFK